MDKYFVKCGTDSMDLLANEVKWGGNGLTFSIDDEVVAHFTSWNYWFKYISENGIEEGEEKKDWIGFELSDEVKELLKKLLNVKE